MRTKTTALACAGLLALSTAALHACTQESGGSGDGGGTASSSSGSGAGGNSGGGTTSSTSGTAGDIGFDAGNQDGSTGGACAGVVVQAESTVKPADIIYVIDNSCSMNQEISGVESNINVNFASIIQNSGVDYQVIMVTGHGSSTLDVCVQPPLSGTTNCSGPPVDVPGQFYHYSLPVYSHDSLCKTLDGLYGNAPDEFSQAPAGWSTWLRPQAVKVFVEITDDGISCTWNGTNFNDQDQINPGQQVALDWDTKLLQAAPAQFGSKADRNYLYYSIVGLPPKPNILDAYDEFEPVITGTCNGGVGPGTGYQWLSKGTHSLRFPVCQDQNQTYDAVFQDIAAGVVDSTKVPCELIIPEEPPGQTYNFEKASVIYTPGGNGTPEEFTFVSSSAACGQAADKFYIEGGLIKLCPAACAKVEGDIDAKLEVSIPCDAIN